jgi:hypothetical protein
MAAKTNSRVRNWSIEEWKSFTSKCQGTRDDFSDLLDRFKANGLTGSTHDVGLKSLRHLWTAMFQLETLITTQQPALSGKVFGLVHGSMRPGIRTPEINRELGRDEWTSLGAELREIRKRIEGLGAELGKARGVGVMTSSQFRKVSKMTRFRGLLNDVVREQHPDWIESPSVFDGPSLEV